MLGTLDFVARTDWVSILPALMMATEARSRIFSVNPIVAPEFSLDLVLIEPSRRPMTPARRPSGDAGGRKPAHQPKLGEAGGVRVPNADNCPMSGAYCTCQTLAIFGGLAHAEASG